MTLIEHWGWSNPVPTGPQPVPFRGPALGPVPGLKPPAPEPEGHGPAPSPGADNPPNPDAPPKGDGPPIPPHEDLPPDWPEWKQDKWRFHYGPLWKLYGWLTELGDFIDCYEKAMYGKKQTGKPFHERALDLAKAFYYDSPTPQQFGEMVACMYANGASDSAIGKWGKMADEITKSPYWKRPVGPTAGWWSQGSGVRF